MVVEARGCWHNELKTAMKEQLIDRYLNSNDLNHGIYLVGWFYCDSWKTPKGPLKKLTIDRAKEFFGRQVVSLSTTGKCVRSVVLDMGLR